jgi:glutathione S-transferase
MKMKIYGDKRSGNCYKIQLTAALLQCEYEWVDMDLLNGDNLTSAFLAKSSVGKIPIIELPDGRVLSESNAIINFLAHGSSYYSAGSSDGSSSDGSGNRSNDDAYSQALIQQWQFFEQYSHEPYIAVARFIQHYLGMPKARRAEYEHKLPSGYKALNILEGALTDKPFLCGDHITTADISLYAYTHVAHEGGFDVSIKRYPALNAWFARIQVQPNYVAMAT